MNETIKNDLYKDEKIKALVTYGMSLFFPPAALIISFIFHRKVKKNNILDSHYIFAKRTLIGSIILFLVNFIFILASGFAAVNFDHNITKTASIIAYLLFYLSFFAIITFYYARIIVGLVRLSVDEIFPNPETYWFGNK